VSISVEIIPGDEILTPKRISQALPVEGTVFCKSAEENQVIEESELLRDNGYTLLLNGKSFYLSRLNQNFDIEPAMDYLEGISVDGVDAGVVADRWQRAGFNYLLSPDQPQDSDSKEFVELVTAITKAVGGAILMASYRFNWSTAELYSPCSFWNSYANLK
jgi:hypothetical protein